jgi:hypothetical protein
MKNLLLILLVLTVMMSCSEDKQKKVVNQPEKIEVSHEVSQWDSTTVNFERGDIHNPANNSLRYLAANQLVYFRDTSTGLCFAAIAASAMSITCVPCEELEKSKVKIYLLEK